MSMRCELPSTVISLIRFQSPPLVHYAQGPALSSVIFFLAFSETGVYNIIVII